MKAQRGSRRNRSTLSLTLSLDGREWLTPRPGHFTPGQETGHFTPAQETGHFTPGQETGYFMGLRAGLDGSGNLAITEIRSPDHPASSESLYRLSYRSVHFFRLRQKSPEQRGSMSLRNGGRSPFWQTTRRYKQSNRTLANLRYQRRIKPYSVNVTSSVFRRVRKNCQKRLLASSCRRIFIKFDI